MPNVLSYLGNIIVVLYVGDISEFAFRFVAISVLAKLKRQSKRQTKNKQGKVMSRLLKAAVLFLPSPLS